MSLPYRWYPTGTTSKPLPDVGDLIAWEHAVWRVIEVTERAEIHWTDEDRKRVGAFLAEYRRIHSPHHVRARPHDRDDANADIHLTCGGVRSGGFDVYRSEHWTACGKCGEPKPCREEMTDRLTDEAVRRMERWNTPGVCPACSEPVTHRQESHTFTVNARIPGGPPVTFHVGRRGCRYQADKYRAELGNSDATLARTLWDETA